MEPLKLFVDVDDTITKSSERIIDLLNVKHNLHKTTANLKDYMYRSIYRDITDEEVEAMYDSDEFFDKLKIDDTFIKMIGENNYDITFVTKGTVTNQTKKAEYLANHINVPYTYRGIGHGKDKSGVNMEGGIQIDDVFDWLENTNASIKILITNGLKTLYNQPESSLTNLYIVSNWDEARTLIEFFDKNREFLKE